MNIINIKNKISLMHYLLFAVIALQVAILVDEDIVQEKTIVVERPNVEDVRNVLSQALAQSLKTGDNLYLNYIKKQDDDTTNINVSSPLDSLLKGDFILIPLDGEGMEESLNSIPLEQLDAMRSATPKRKVVFSAFGYSMQDCGVGKNGRQKYCISKNSDKESLDKAFYDEKIVVTE